MFAELGGYFPVDVHEPSHVPPAGWERVCDTLDFVGLAPRVDFVARSLADRHIRHEVLPRARLRRIAGSVMHQGLVARILSPYLAAQLRGVDLSLRPEDVWWQPGVLTGPVPLSLTRQEAPRFGRDTGTPDNVVAALSTEVHTLTQTPRTALDGNVFSALATAARLLIHSGEDAEQVGQALSHSLNRVPHGREALAPGAGGTRRSSCCLIYQAYGSRRFLCGDCVLGA